MLRKWASLETVSSDGRRAWTGQRVDHTSGWKTEGGAYLTREEIQERNACCLSSGEIPYCGDKEIPSICPLLFGGYTLLPPRHDLANLPPKPSEVIQETDAGIFTLLQGHISQCRHGITVASCRDTCCGRAISDTIRHVLVEIAQCSPTSDVYSRDVVLVAFVLESKDSAGHANSSNNALASFKSAVSKPSVNQ